MDITISNKLKLPHMCKTYDHNLIKQRYQDYWEQMQVRYNLNYSKIPDKMKLYIKRDYKIKTKDYITLYNFRNFTDGNEEIYRLKEIFSGQIIYYNVKKKYITVKDKNDNVFSTILGATIFIKIDAIASKPSRRKKYIV